MTAFSQSGYMDNALNYSRLIIAKTENGGYIQVGTYKVVGTQYLYGKGIEGDLFSTEAKAWNVHLSYNTYNQQVEFTSTSNPDKPLTKDPGEIDSFIIHAKPDIGVNNPIKFYYGALIGAKDKFYYQEVCTGTRYKLYKRYQSELGYVSTNYIQPDLRQFDLNYDFYYADAETKTFKKIKANASSVIKEFKSVLDLSKTITQDDFTSNPEIAFCKAFTALNQK